jgi:hypothetical protein
LGFICQRNSSFHLKTLQKKAKVFPFKRSSSNTNLNKLQ